MVCHQNLLHPEIHELWKEALRGGYVTTLCRDEVINTHLYVNSFFETIKGYNKRVAEVKEWYHQAVQTA